MSEVKKSTYNEFASLPEYEVPAMKDGKRLLGVTELPQWSGVILPPEIGAIIDVSINKLGVARVIGYFVSEGWLGVLVKFFAPPVWFINQNGYDAKAHVFGAEIGAVLDCAPDVPGPSQEQLAAVQHFANKHGASWKTDLSIAWFDGTDANEPDGHLLRQVRNQHGPDWLNSADNQIVPKKAPRC